MMKRLPATAVTAILGLWVSFEAVHAGADERRVHYEGFNGGWSGIEARGVMIGVSATADAVGVVGGGVRREGEWLYTVDATVEFDLEHLLSWPGASCFLYVLGNGGGDPGSHAGDIQGINNIEAPDTWKLYEAWVDQRFAGGRASVRAGLYDVNSEFDVLPAAGVFLNSSHGIGAAFGNSGINGPSVFPTTSLAARVAVALRRSLLFRAVVADGVPGDPADTEGTHIAWRDGDGVLYVGELEWRRVAEVAAGFWGYTSKFQTGGDVVEAGTAGGYLTTEIQLAGAREDRGPGVSAFARAGFAGETGNAVDRFLGAGLVARATLFGIAGQEFGAGVAAARPVGGGGWEVALEITWRFSPAPWLSVQPDFQYVIDPGAGGGTDDCSVLGLRVTVER